MIFVFWGLSSKVCKLYKISLPAVSIHTKSQSESFPQGQIHWSYSPNTAGRRKRNTQQRQNSAALTVASDSVGGNMEIAMVLMSSMRHGPCIHKLLLYYPVTDAYFDTPSYRQFATGYYLYREGMKWFWRQYTASMEDRNQMTASPLRADIDCLRCFPPPMIINSQADVL